MAIEWIRLFQTELEQGSAEKQAGLWESGRLKKQGPTPQDAGHAVYRQPEQVAVMIMHFVQGLTTKKTGAFEGRRSCS